MKDDTIYRQAAIKHLKHRLYETAMNNPDLAGVFSEMADHRVETWIDELSSAQSERKRGNWVGIDDEPCETFIYKFEGGLLKEVAPLVYCKDCIHRPVLKYNGFEEWVEAPMKEYTNSRGTWWGHDYTCPYVVGDVEHDRRPLGHLFCSFGEREDEPR